jgi:hypothetical protein
MNQKSTYHTTVGMMTQLSLGLPHCHFCCSQACPLYKAVLVVEERLPWEEGALACGVESLHLVLSSNQGINIVHKDWL